MCPVDDSASDLVGTLGFFFVSDVLIILLSGLTLTQNLYDGTRA